MELVSSSERHGMMNDVNGLAAAALGRVYTVTSLPSHIWSLNGMFFFSFNFLLLFFQLFTFILFIDFLLHPDRLEQKHGDREVCCLWCRVR